MPATSPARPTDTRRSARLLTRAAAVLGATVAATVIATGMTTATASATGLCQLDRPCTNLSFNAATLTVNAKIYPGTPEADFFQVRWSIAHQGGGVQTFPQQKVTGDTSALGPIASADRGATITASVQSCDSGVFGSSCTPWEVETIVPVPMPYGPDTCKAGFVWRNAFSGDTNCVTTRSRDQAAADNAAAASRRDPKGAYGPDSCISGYVWRAARPGDDVCVLPAIRTQTQQENSAPSINKV